MKEEWHIFKWLLHHLGRFPLNPDDTVCENITETEYLEEIPIETVEIIHRLNFNQFNRWFKDLVCGLNRYKGQITVRPKLFDILERMAFLFAYEQRMEPVDSAILESIIRNLEICETDQKVLRDYFYSADHYVDGATPLKVHDFVQSELKLLLVPSEIVFFVSRLKQFKSLRDKLERILCRKTGAEFSLNHHHRAQKIISGLLANKISVVADYKSADLDDLVGFSVIINDHRLPMPQTGEKVLEQYVEKVQTRFSSLPGLSVFVFKKMNQAGLESVNLYLVGLLNHRDFGNLPVRIQFNFQSALCQYSAMCYNYKIHGRWVCPPWTSGISFEQISKQRQLQRQLYERLKRFTDRRFLNSANFSLKKFISIDDKSGQAVSSYFFSLPLWSVDSPPRKRPRQRAGRLKRADLAEIDAGKGKVRILKKK